MHRDHCDRCSLNSGVTTASNAKRERIHCPVRGHCVEASTSAIMYLTNFRDKVILISHYNLWQCLAAFPDSLSEPQATDETVSDIPVWISYPLPRNWVLQIIEHARLFSRIVCTKQVLSTFRDRGYLIPYSLAKIVLTALSTTTPKCCVSCSLYPQCIDASVL